MAFNVADFASNIARYGTLQTNKFEVKFYDGVRSNNPSSPSVISENIYENLNLIPQEIESFRRGFEIQRHRIDSVKMPGATIDTYESRRYGVGPNIKVGTNVRMEPFSISVITDKNYDLYKFFHTWMNAVFDFSGLLVNRVSTRIPTFLTSYKSEYVMDAEVSIYENNAEVKVDYRFYQVFPIGITEPSLSWRDNNSIHKFDVTFAYTNWQIDNRNRPPPPQ
jgi:hypothetical protein